jgi:hypothetical protein
VESTIAKEQKQNNPEKKMTGGLYGKGNKEGNSRSVYGRAALRRRKRPA